jgi:excisionase family DNA binding protein
VSSFIPSLPGEPLLSVSEVAERAGCSRQAVQDAIRNGKLMACRAAGRILITECEAERFIREWPATKKGVAARWHEFRDWQGRQRSIAQQRLESRTERDGAAS